MRARKPIVLVDDSPESERVIRLFVEKGIDFVKYHIKKFEESCCMELPTTKAPSIIAVEGIFREESQITSYIDFAKQNKIQRKREVETESSYW